LSYKEQRELEAIPERIQNLESEQSELQQQIVRAGRAAFWCVFAAVFALGMVGI
jgi:hypothetical protein